MHPNNSGSCVMGVSTGALKVPPGLQLGSHQDCRMESGLTWEGLGGTTASVGGDSQMN